MIPNPCILTDVTRCIGCEECVLACRKINDLPVTDPPPRPGDRAGELSATRWTSVVRKPGNHFVRRQCRHCLEPACVSVCPVGALQKTPEGPVIYDKSICMGCRYCMMACPFGIPRYQWSSATPAVRKCVLCYPHLKSGRIEKPACVSACPTQATIFGPRDEMLAEARHRLNSEPGRYLHRIWGAQEVGGTSVLLISDIPLDFLAGNGGENLGTEPLPERTWDALKLVPIEFAGMGVLMSAVYWIIERRRKIAGPEGGDRKNETTEGNDHGE
jgi:formate dehydrogenase iron-sulfur subunit